MVISLIGEGINSMVETIHQLEAENEKLKFRLSNVSNSVKIALLEQLEELSEHIPCEVYTKKVIEIKSNFNDC